MKLPGRFVISLAAIAVLLTGCGGGGGTSVTTSMANVVPSPVPLFPVQPGSVIKHVVIIVQENRSFDNLFSGFPGADTASGGTMSNGAYVPLATVPLGDGTDPSHLRMDFINSFDGGKMDGFDKVGTFGPPKPATYAYARVPQSEVQPYWDLAKNYGIADRMFQSSTSASFTQHQYLIAGQAGGLTDVPSAFPWGCDAPSGTTTVTINANGSLGVGPFPCFSYRTIADSLDAKGVTWGYYAPAVNGGDVSGNIWSAFDAILPVRYGADWARNIHSPETNVLSDITAGSLPSVSIVVPDARNSDHARFYAVNGPAWVSSIVNAIGGSKYWSDTAIFVTWDDWGGWYDHVPPIQIDAEGPGMRVALLAISPYAKRGYVSHTIYETASLTRFVEEVFLLPSLGQRDATANSPVDMFDFTQPVKALARVRSTKSIRDFQMQPPSGVAPDDD